MEEKGQNSLTIGDILDQLTKPAILKSPEVSPPRPVVILKSPLPTLVAPKENTQSSMKMPELGGVKMPELGNQPSKIVAGESSPTEISISIRTMSDDLARLKQGEKLSVTVIKKQTASSNPPAQVISKVPNEPPRPTLPRKTFSAAKPVIPPIVSGGGTNRLPPVQQGSTKVRLPSISELSQTTKGEVEHFHPEKVISRNEEDDTLPPFLGAPVPKKKTVKPEDEKVEYGLIARIISKGLTTGIISTIIVAILVYFAVYYFFFDRSMFTEPTPTPAPIASKTPPLDINELNNIFSNVSSVNLQLSSDNKISGAILKSFVDAQVLEKNQFRRLNISNQGGQIKRFNEMLDALFIDYPADLRNELGGEAMILIYGQSELISEEKDKTTPKRMIFIAEIKNKDKIDAIMKVWEATLPESFKEIFGYDSAKRASAVFLDNKYRDIMIRYMNFPLPDKSLDFAVTPSLTGKYYLMISNSRESMYSPTDRIRGL